MKGEEKTAAMSTLDLGSL